MREIKFRVFDLTSEEYCGYDGNRIIDLEYSMRVGAFMMDNDAYDFERNHKYAVEQFTGLKDKNGKEIYEGDIVRYNEGNEANPVYCNLVVRYVHHGFYAEGHDGFDWLQKNFLDERLYEIIGNIHENEDLLK